MMGIRVMGTWVMGHIATIMHRSRWGTGVMAHMDNGAHSECISEFSEYIH